MRVTGRFVCITTIGAVLAAFTGRPWLVAAWIGLVLAAACLDATLALSPRTVSITRSQVPDVRVGESTSSVIVIGTSRLPWPLRRARLTVRDSWVPSANAGPDRHDLRLRGNDARRIETPLRPERRTTLDAGPVTVLSRGPLGLAARQRSFVVPGAVRVLPEFRARKELPSRLARLREMDGRAAVMVRGEGTEFDSLRQYVAGDDVRSIDWRATARSTETVVRTWRPERDRQVAIVLDGGRTSAIRSGTGTVLDADIEAALLLAAIADHAGDRVRAIVVDRVIREQIVAGAGGKALQSVASGLVDARSELVETRWQVAIGHVLATVGQRSLVVLATALDPAALLSAMLPPLPALLHRHAVIVAAPEPETPYQDGQAPDAFEKAAQVRERLDRAETIRQLRALGATVVTAAPDALAGAVADAYLTLKASGKL